MTGGADLYVIHKNNYMLCVYEEKSVNTDLL